MTRLRIDAASLWEIHRLSYLQAARRGGTESQTLPFLEATVSWLPEELDGVVATSDLQGVVPSWQGGGEPMLLGIHVADQLYQLADAGLVPEPDRLGILLAGDLYSAPGADKRGASGDVRAVWQSFGGAFRWVAGVAGNHDRFGTEAEERALLSGSSVQRLDGEVCEVDGLRIGGVGDIVGNPTKPGRKDETTFLKQLAAGSAQEPDFVVLHEGPDGERSEQRGNERVRAQLESAAASLAVCGHIHWDEPLSTLGHGQILNVDSRVVILRRATRKDSR